MPTPTIARFALASAIALAAPASPVTDAEHQPPAPRPSRQFHVNPATGDDSSPSGPFRTIARAIQLAQPGDTIHLARARYGESAIFLNRSGAPGQPITLDGHGATLDGTDPIDPALWENLGRGLHRTRSPGAHMNLATLLRWFFVIDGRVVRMGRSGKSAHAPFKDPRALGPDEWTFVQDPAPPPDKGDPLWDARRAPGTFYIRVPEGVDMGKRSIRAPIRANGVSFAGDCRHIVVRDLVATRFHNDGFNIHGVTREIFLESIAATECGDDGISAHDDCHCRVRGLRSTSNSTGICDVGKSQTWYDDVVIRDCIGHDLFFVEPGRHEIRNARILSSALRAVTVDGRTATPGTPCELILRDSVIRRIAPRGEIRVASHATLDAQRTTLVNLALNADGPSVRLEHCTLAGSPPPAILLAERTRWIASGNRYDLALFQHGTRIYRADGFADLQRESAQETGSRWAPIDPATLPPAE